MSTKSCFVVVLAYRDEVGNSKLSDLWTESTVHSFYTAADTRWGFVSVKVPSVGGGVVGFRWQRGVDAGSTQHSPGVGMSYAELETRAVPCWGQGSLTP